MAPRRRKGYGRAGGCRCGGTHGKTRNSKTVPAAQFRQLSRKYDQLAQIIGAFAGDTPLPQKVRLFRSDRDRPATVGQAIARIVGGVPVNLNEFPDCVLVGRRRANGNFDWFCTGVLIHPRIVLTAAHCFEPSNPANVVALNAEDVDDLQNAEIRGVRRMVRHPRYPATGFHDIAVMILRRAATIAPVRIATAAELAQAAQTTLVGFGNDDVLSTRGFGIKRKVTVPITHPATSGNPNADEQLLGFEGDLEFVAGGGGFDSCNGDSGGPAYITVAGDRVVAGLTSRATETSRNPCGEGGIYTRTDVHRAFIRRIAAREGINF